MPSIFDDGQIAPHIIRTRCPPFNAETVKHACSSQLVALAARHKYELEEAARLNFQPLAVASIKQRHAVEQSLLEERIKAAIGRWNLPITSTSQGGVGSSSLPLSFIPATTFNVVDEQPRYFRILVWNLENFTRDRRPRGTQPMDSIRNQARVAIIADVLVRMRVDLLLIMETGSDVGTATTRIARRAAQKRGEAPWEPLVSPATGALPEVALSYRDVNLGRPSGLKALSLRTLFDVYVVTPCPETAPADVTARQISDAWSVLRQASPEALRQLPALDESSALDNGFPHAKLVMRLVEWLEKTARPVALALHGQLEADVDVVHRVTHEVANELAGQALQSEPDDIAYAVLSARDARMALDDVDPPSDEAAAVIEAGIACLQALELVLLFVLKAQAGGFPTAGLAHRVFRSDSSYDGLVPLAAFLCTGAQHVTLQAIDRRLGPASGELDNDVLLDALQRVGAVSRQIETYGIVYRQPFPGALEALLERGVLAHGFTGGLDEEAARYGIIQAPLSKDELPIQQAGGLLNWRSALQITVPASRSVHLPLAVYHTRYTGTAEIKKMEEGLNAEQNTVLARCMSVWMMAGAGLPGHSELGPPLLVGDFNVPDAFLNEQPPPRSKAKTVVGPAAKRLEIRTRFFLEMASRGYLRHSTGGAVNTGYPCTTLKAYSSIMKGEGTLSQPYDGTYQPFDYAGGKVALASGVVSIAALLPDSVLDENVLGVPSQATDGDELDPDAEEEEQEEGVVVDDGAMQEEEQTQPAPEVTRTVRQALAVEVGRVYRSLIRGIYEPVDELLGYIERKMQVADGELRRLLNLITQRHAAYDQGAVIRVKWFVQSCAGGGTQTCLQATGSDWLTDWQNLLRSVGEECDRRGLSTGFQPVSKRFFDVADAVKAVQAQLTALETDPEVRRLIAYRAAVSDHLPQIIEVDLQPG